MLQSVYVMKGMRWLLILALVGCVSESESSRLYELEGRAQHCGSSIQICAVDTNVPAVVTCMNEALADGTLVQASWTDKTTASRTNHVFTEADHFHVYLTESDEIDGPVILGESTCPGPLATIQTAECGMYLQFELGGC